MKTNCCGWRRTWLVFTLFIVVSFKIKGQAPETASQAPQSAELLTAAQLGAIVTIKGTKGAGTGFFGKYLDQVFVFTNQHVVDGIPDATLMTQSGKALKWRGVYAADEADVMLFHLVEVPKEIVPLEVPKAIESIATKGDEVVIPGNSQGGGVVTETPGKVLGIGPDKVETDCPVYRGNSGGPIIHVKTGQVIGVLTYAEKLDLSEFEKVSFERRESSLKSEIRYFGYRIDSVATWVPINWVYFQTSASLLDKAQEELQLLLNHDERHQDFHLSWNRFQEFVKTDRRSPVDVIDGAKRFLRDYHSYLSRIPKPLTGRSLTFTQRENLKAILSILDERKSHIAPSERNLELLLELVRRDGVR